MFYKFDLQRVLDLRTFGIHQMIYYEYDRHYTKGYFSTNQHPLPGTASRASTILASRFVAII